MIKLKLNEMLETRGLTAYGLHVKSKGKGKKAKARLHQSVISKIKNNKSKALQLDILSVLCELLDCQPADLMIYEPTTRNASTTQNVARATQSAKHTQNANTTQFVSDNERLLTTADIAERLGLSKKSVTDYINKGILPTIQPKGARTPHFVKESDYPAFELYYRNLTGKSKP
jgi:DNA-binding Xre family transcriptional regulator/predicted DNA-binding transcriptional regulator AlpA